MRSPSGEPGTPWFETRVAAALIVLVGVAALLLFMSVEVAEDGTSATSLAAGSAEAVMVVIPVIVALLLYREVARTRRRQGELLRHLAAAQAAGAAWRREKRELLRGLGEAIDQQFRTWGLTDAEREVGLLMLKGLNHKEIASVRGTSERTVRQQARAIYAKSNLSGRAALSAYFLEDLLLPAEQRG